ncbi:Nramp family divalent metal transporter [candidate division KSB1 bacterium]|nr:Nramp family divalent metal transporter [candidate division KSB1 bacterium]
MKETPTISNTSIKTPPKGWAVLALLGPSFIWCAEYIGSGEVILATRTGAILGPTVLWAVVVGIFLKYWIGLCGARYTVCTGEGMIDMIGRMPGPKNSALWIVLVAQFISATISIGSIAAAAGVFLSSFIPVSPYLGGWIVTILAFSVVWTGAFDLMKTIMSFFVLIIIVGTLYVSIKIFPGFSTIIDGLLLKIPDVPAWAINKAGVHPNPWREILPLLGWAAGGFASQVWYTYWVLGAGYGAASGRGYGQPADIQSLRNMTRTTAQKILGWCRVMYVDATVAVVIGILITCSFLLAGAGVLRPNEMAPEGPDVAVSLSTLFSSRWGSAGGFLFLLSGLFALVGTQMGQMAGWPRLLADSFRLCVPGFNRIKWKIQFRAFLLFFLCTNMIIVFTLGLKPVFLVKIGAVLDGLLLTPLQAFWVAIGLYWIMPRMLSKDAARVLKPHWILAAGLVTAFLVFGYFCVFQIPFIL